MESRVSALDEAAMKSLSEGSRARPKLQLELYPPPTPVFTSLAITSSPRTKPSLLQKELSGVLLAKDYSQLAVAAAAVLPRLDALGIFEPGTVSLTLERPPKLLVDTQDTRPPPVLVFRAVEKDVLRLEAKPTATISGLKVGSAEVGYEANGLLRNFTGHGELLSGRYYGQNGCPPEVHASITAPLTLSLPASSVVVPLTVTGEVGREESSQRNTSSFTAEKCVGRLTIATASDTTATSTATSTAAAAADVGVSAATTASVRREHTFVFEAGTRRVLPVAVALGSGSTTANSLFSSSPSMFTSPSCNPLLPSASPFATTNTANNATANNDTSKPSMFVASAPVLAAAAQGAAAKLSAAYMYRRSSVQAFSFTPSSSPPLPSKTTTTLHDKNAASDGVVISVVAPGSVPVSGWVGAGSLEIARTSGTGVRSGGGGCGSDAGGGASHALSSIVSRTATTLLSTVWQSSGREQGGGGISGLGSSDAHVLKLGVSAKKHLTLTGPYHFEVPPPSPSTSLPSPTVNTATPLPESSQDKQKVSLEDPSTLTSTATRGCAAGVVLSLSADAAFLYPLLTQTRPGSSSSSSSSPPSPAPPVAGPAGGVVTSVPDDGLFGGSHLIDRFHLGGPQRFTSTSSQQSGGGCFAGGDGSLRGFAISGVGDRAPITSVLAPSMNGSTAGTDTTATISGNEAGRGGTGGVGGGGGGGDASGGGGGWLSGLGRWSGYSNNNISNTSSSSADSTNNSNPSSGDALGGNGRFTCCAELSAPLPLPQLAMAGLRGSLSLHGGLLTNTAPNPLRALLVPHAATNSLLSHPASASSWLKDALRACVTVGVGLPLGPAANVEVLCSKHLLKQPMDRAETWQLAIGLGIG